MAACTNNNNSAVDLNNTSWSRNSVCSAGSDRMSCWPQTQAGYLAVVPCPTHFEGLTLAPGNATRLCMDNGTWHKPNYSQCLDLSILDPPQSHSFHNQVHRIIYYVGFSISVVALSIALFLFLFFKSLRCLRNNIHCHLIVSFILRILLWLKMSPTMHVFVLQETSYVHQWICKTILSLFNYLQMTNYFWMLVEGLYLHTILVCAFAQERLRIWHYAAFGWGFPVVFIIAWTIAKSKHDNNTCWLPSDSKLEYIYVIPIFMALLVNLVFLASILWILVTKLKASNSSQNCLYRKAARATLVLFPLLGPTYLLFFYLPETTTYLYLRYINVVLQSIQGFFVATCYCFMNVEVQSAVKNYFSRWRDWRTLSTRTQTEHTVVQADPVSQHHNNTHHQNELKPSKAAVETLKKGPNSSETRIEEFPLRNSISTGRGGYLNGMCLCMEQLDRGGVDVGSKEVEELEWFRENGTRSGEAFCYFHNLATYDQNFDRGIDLDSIKEELV